MCVSIDADYSPPVVSKKALSKKRMVEIAHKIVGLLPFYLPHRRPMNERERRVYDEFDITLPLAYLVSEGDAAPSKGAGKFLNDETLRSIKQALGVSDDNQE